MQFKAPYPELYELNVHLPTLNVRANHREAKPIKYSWMLRHVPMAPPRGTWMTLGG